jgi:Holliday junction resolvase
MTTQGNLDDKARKIREAITQLGWDIEITALIERVKQFDSGLVHEDEFFYILNWSNKCSLIHKLDQFQPPPQTQKKEYIIPDLHVIFDVNGVKKPYYIEVKTSKDNHLNWTEKYYQGLQNYSEINQIPILIAWKWKTFDIWTLFELKHFKKSITNYKIDLETAHIENLMSKLVGDYMVFPYENFGFHIKFKKLRVVKKEDNETSFDVVIDSIYCSGDSGIETKEIDKGILALLFSLPLEEKVEETDSHLIYSFVPSPNKSSFAQVIPTRLTQAFAKTDVNWMQLIREKNFPISYDSLLDSLKAGIDKKVIRNIIFYVPRSK